MLRACAPEEADAVRGGYPDEVAYRLPEGASAPVGAGRPPLAIAPAVRSLPSENISGRAPLQPPSLFTHPFVAALFGTPPHGIPGIDPWAFQERTAAAPARNFLGAFGGRSVVSKP